MATSNQRIRAYKAGGAIPAGSFVKFGSDDETVVACGDGETAIGVYMGKEAAASGDRVEIALPGGGCRILLSATLARGAFGYSDANGAADAGSAGDIAGVLIMESGVSGDIVSAEMIVGPAHA